MGKKLYLCKKKKSWGEKKNMFQKKKVGKIGKKKNIMFIKKS